MLRAERQSARMSKITNDRLTRQHMATVNINGLSTKHVIKQHWCSDW